MMVFGNSSIYPYYSLPTAGTGAGVKGATAGLPCGKSTRRISRRCFFRLKSRDRQLIDDSTAAVRNNPPIPKATMIALPVGVRLRPSEIDSIVLNPRQPSTACTVKIARAEMTMFVSAAGSSHF